MTQPQTGVPTDAELPGWAQERAQPNRGRQLLYAAVILFLIALFGFMLWQRNHTPANYAPAPQQAVAVAEAASAPAPAASAAARVVEPEVAAAASPKTYPVKATDTLGKRFGKNWKAVCDLNAELLKGDCNHLEVGWVLNLPEGVEPLEDQVPPAKKVTKVAPVVLPKTNALGEILYRRVGTAPLNGCGKRDIADISREAWNVLGLSEEDQAWLQLNADLKAGPRINITSTEGLIKILPDTRLEQVTFCRSGKVVAMGPMRTAWDADTAVYGERFVLPSGKVLVWMRNCFYWVLLPEEAPKLVPPPPPAPPPVIEPDPPVELPPPPPAPAPVPPATVTEAPKDSCDVIDYNGVVGAEIEPRHDGGDDAQSLFLSAGLRCLTRLPTDDGSHGVGPSILATAWQGHVNDRAGKYQGYKAVPQVTYKRIMDEGHTENISFGVGWTGDKFRQGDYASSKRSYLAELSADASFYQRRLLGEVWRPEFQVFGSVGKPFGTHASQSWQGQPIADTSALERNPLIVQLGARQWWYEDDDTPLLPYSQAGLFYQGSESQSASVRFIGASDRERRVGCGIGRDYDLVKGGSVAAFGCWVDVVKTVEVSRIAARKAQFRARNEAAGIHVNPVNGGIRLDDPAKYLGEPIATDTP
ncbi:MAG: hypothetical protein ACEQSB_04090 [Undibacterium sp.]